MEGFPSGQREQTVNLSSMTSVVRINHLPPKQKDIPKGMSFFCFGGRWLWIRKPALRNVPVARFNRRGFAAAKRIHHRTGRHACSSVVRGLHQTLKLDTRPKRSAGSWKRAGGTFQPPWLCRSKANPPPNGSAGVWQYGYGTAPANHGRHAPNPKGRTGCSIAKSTCTGYLQRYIAVCDVIP